MKVMWTSFDWDTCRGYEIGEAVKGVRPNGVGSIRMVRPVRLEVSGGGDVVKDGKWVPAVMLRDEERVMEDLVKGFRYALVGMGESEKFGFDRIGSMLGAEAWRVVEEIERYGIGGSRVHIVKEVGSLVGELVGILKAMKRVREMGVRGAPRKYEIGWIEDALTEIEGNLKLLVDSIGEVVER